MSIPREIKIKSGQLPTQPGVYLFKDKKGQVVYVGKATNLRSRVGSYWKYTEAELPSRRKLGFPVSGRPIDEMLHEVRRIDYQVTDSVIEALILEANLIRKYMPAYNVKEKDDKSFLYVVITKEQWPRVQLVRGNELAYGKWHIANHKRPLAISYKLLAISGPYTSASSIRAALDLIRKWFPWSTCKPLRTTSYILRPRPCFDYHIGRCPGVCVGAVTRRNYLKNISNVILFLDGKKTRVLKNVEREMKMAAKGERFEEAEKLKRKLFALRHIRDVAILKADRTQQTADRSSRRPLAVSGKPINIFGRIEGYDISNISGTSAVGSMVVFQDGEPAKSEYRKFKITTVAGINDVAMMREVLERRFTHSRPPLNLPLKKGEKEGGSWPLPDLILIDGGWGQVNAAREVVDDIRRQGLRSGRRPCLPDIPIVGIAKGFDRKQDQPIFDENNPELARIVANHKDLLLRVRDEAHRFAVAYHRKIRGRALST